MGWFGLTAASTWVSFVSSVGTYDCISSSEIRRSGSEGTEFRAAGVAGILELKASFDSD